MIARILGIVFLGWALGFFIFALDMPGPTANSTTDAIVVPTGAAGRIARGLELLRDRQARRMLVTGVDPEVKPREFAAEYKVPQRLLNCCITLDFEAVDTRSNAQETAMWMADNKYTSMRLVTNDWHMARAVLELRRALPEDVTIIEDAVVSDPNLRTIFLEYNKLLAAMASVVVDWAG